MSHDLPRAVLLDLDDTILDDSGSAVACWREACFDHAPELEAVDPAALHDAIERTREWYWKDPDRHRLGRLDLTVARREVTRLALRDLGIDDVDLAAKIGDRYATLRDMRLEPIEGAIETVRWLRDRGCMTALLTNGNGHGQRTKIARFQLAPYFDAILIEGELGYGKPDRRVYDLALEKLRVPPEDAWMAGDNLEWDVVAPQRLGITGIWIDAHGAGVREPRGTRPDRVIRRLSDLRS